MRLVVHFAAMMGGALLLGFGLSYFALTDGRFFGAYQWSSWFARPEVGAPDPDPYTKAYLARSGTLQLGRGEGVQFIATHDSNGQALTRNCTYRVAGETPVATFWTLRATTSNGANVAHESGAQSMHSNRLSRANDGLAIIYVGKQLMPGNWLELAGDGSFQLTLTFYDASVFAGFGTTVNALPIITNEGCA